MAQPPRSTSSPEPAAPSGSAQPPTRSHGRGGAGNINSKPGAQLDASALQTPTIKQQTYTTGRGGSGNMAANDPLDPTTARLAQDVDAPRAHEREIKGTYHWGRGGEGNMMTVGNNSNTNHTGNGNGGDGGSKGTTTTAATTSTLGGGGGGEATRPGNGSSGHAKSDSRPSNAMRSISRSGGDPEAPRRGSFKNAVERGKEFLGLGAAKEGANAAAAAAKGGESAIE